MKRKTKVIATLGPVSSSPQMIEKLILAGVNIFRLNFSHGTPQAHGALIKKIRTVASHHKQPIGILADLPGPKLRVGEFEHGDPIFLSNRKHTILTTKKIEGNAQLIPVGFSHLPQSVKKGDRVLLADGKLELCVEKVSGTEVHCQIVVGGELRPHQGLNLPDRHLDIPSFTFQDKKAIELLEHVEADHIALSFVQTAQDIERVKKMLKTKKMDVSVIAKIEKPEALKHISEILEVVNGIMIARGDLGVELPTEDVPVAQKLLIREAAQKAIPVITATQMLESMTSNSRPTRAETTDVANAIWDGTDAVMLSGETATGKYPVEAVEMMVKIIQKAESHSHLGWEHQFRQDLHPVLQSAAKIASPQNHKAIITYTESGSTAITLSKFRPSVPIFAITPLEQTRQKLTLAWGVKSFLAKRGHSADDMIRLGDAALMKHAGLKKGDPVVVTAGTRLTSGATNMMKIHKVGE